MIGFAVADLGTVYGLIAKIARHLCVCMPQGLCDCGIRPFIFPYSRLAEGLVALACGIMTIRAPRRWLSACLLLLVFASWRSSMQYDLGLKYSSSEPIPTRIAWLLFDLIWPIIGITMIIATRSARRVLSFNEAASPLCRSCGYDLRGAVSLACPECGDSYSPIEFYRLKVRGPLLLIRAFGWIMITLGIAEIGFHVHLIVGAARYFSGGSVEVPWQVDEMMAFPSLQAALAQIAEGMVHLACGIVTLRRPDLLFRASVISLVVALAGATLHWQGTMNNFSLRLFGHFSWFCDSFLVPAIAMAFVVALVRARRGIRMIRQRGPMCRICSDDLRDSKGLACLKCGQVYTPCEFCEL